jgi:Tol biopolymer transport system component
MRILTEGSTLFDPIWSPDARLLAFPVWERGRDWLHVIKPDGSDETRVAPLPPNPWIAWAPDGHRLTAASSSWGLTRSIFVISLEGRRRRVALGKHPSWSPDGSKIAYSSGRIGRPGGGLFVVDPRTKEGRQLTNPTDASDAYPRWSPDGRTILFLRYPAGQTNEDGPYADLWSYDVASPTATQIRDHQNDLNGIDEPTWSPSGKSITYSLVADDSIQTVVARPDGSNPQLVRTHQRQSAYADWSPDGRSLIFSAYMGIRVARARTGRSWFVVRDGKVYWGQPDWAPC